MKKRKSNMMESHEKEEGHNGMYEQAGGHVEKKNPCKKRNWEGGGAKEQMTRRGNHQMCPAK